MPEGVATAGQVLTAGVHDDPEQQPPAGPDAPKGWAWDRKGRSWKPRQRGPVLWHADSAEAPQSSPAAAGGSDDYGPRDPDPHYMADDHKGDGGEAPAFDEVPQEVKDDIAGLAGLVATPILALARAVDPYCGGALADSFEDVFDATLPLICRSKKVIEYFSDEHNDWLMWGKLAMALAPVGKAVVEHHVLRTVETVRDEKTGAVSVRRKVRGGQQGDHLTPKPQPEYAYPAA